MSKVCQALKADCRGMVFVLLDATVDDMVTERAYECCLLRSCMLCAEGAGLLVCEY